MEGRKRGSSYFVFALSTWTLFFFSLKNPRGEILKSCRRYYVVVLRLAEITWLIMKPLRKEIMSKSTIGNVAVTLVGVAVVYTAGHILEKGLRNAFTR